VDHHKTGHPHTHVIVRGKDDAGVDLIIAREYIAQGLRERVAELVSLDLGPRTDLEIERRLRREVEQERLTSIDRGLIRDAGEASMVRATGRNAFQQSLRAGRLQKLTHLGLAAEVAPGQWQLSDGLEDTLRRMGERGDIIKLMHRDLAERGIARASSDYVIYDPADPEVRPITGRLVRRGLTDELNDRHYVIVDAVDGRTHFVDIGKGEATAPLPEDGIISVIPKRAEARGVDRTIAEIATANGGRYDVDIHLRHDPTATADFAETHVRRLEAMRRLAGMVEREPQGTWIIAADHLERAATYERRQAKDTPVMVHTLSALPLDQQIGADGATWLDRQLVAAEPEPLRDGGFGKGVQDALDRRRQWLIEQDLAAEEQGHTIYRANMLGTLRHRDLVMTGAQLSRETGSDFSETQVGERIEGIYRRPLELASGNFALIERSRGFTLVPWRPELERKLGQHVSGIMREGAVSWAQGRQLGGPSIS
jgi:hypothetical protein